MVFYVCSVFSIQALIVIHMSNLLILSLRITVNLVEI